MSEMIKKDRRILAAYRKGIQVGKRLKHEQWAEALGELLKKERKNLAFRKKHTPPYSPLFDELNGGIKKLEELKALIEEK